MDNPHLNRRLQVLLSHLNRMGAAPSLGHQSTLRSDLRPVLRWVDGPTKNEVRLICARTGVRGVVLERTASGELLAAAARRAGAAVTNGAKLLSQVGNVPLAAVLAQDRLLARVATAELRARPRGGDPSRVLAEATALAWTHLAEEDEAVLETLAQLLADCPDRTLPEVATVARVLCSTRR